MSEYIWWTGRERGPRDLQTPRARFHTTHASSIPRTPLPSFPTINPSPEPVNSPPNSPANASKYSRSSLIVAASFVIAGTGRPSWTSDERRNVRVSASGSGTPVGMGLRVEVEIFALRDCTSLTCRRIPAIRTHSCAG